MNASQPVSAIPKVKITAHEIKRELRKMLDRQKNGTAGRWAVFEELRLGTGYARSEYDGDRFVRDRRESRIDLFAIDCWPGQDSRHERRAYEIKVDRGDLVNEFKAPEKRAPWLEVVSAFYIVVPRGLTTPAEVAERAPECGLVTYKPPRERPDPALCDCGNLGEVEWKHSFGCTYKDASRDFLHGKVFHTARPAMKLDGCAPSWGLVASILRKAAS